ncbi:hypothetical protein NQZ68_013980 [Dissostichus eleginoides]|nr:hypothetical protein NQZ68_013980 [Dissostichus eleginoides]
MPLGSTAVTVSGRRRRWPDVTPAGALTRALLRPLAPPRVSTTRHHLSAQRLTGELAPRRSSASGVSLAVRCEPTGSGLVTV